MRGFGRLQLPPMMFYAWSSDSQMEAWFWLTPVVGPCGVLVHFQLRPRQRSRMIATLWSEIRVVSRSGRRTLHVLKVCCLCDRSRGGSTGNEENFMRFLFVFVFLSLGQHMCRQLHVF